jgi:Ca2+-binding RTX toxin-like protein
VVRVNNYTSHNRVELIDGAQGRNRIEGTADADTMDFRVTELRNIEAIDGLGGDDFIIGSLGADVIIGGPGNDELRGDQGDDKFLVFGAQGFDRVTGGEGFDTLLGSADDDRIGLSYYSAAISVELIDGGDGVNVITGNDADNTLDFSNTTLRNIARIDGQGGRDKIKGSAGNDTIDGGPGADTIEAGAGDDTILFYGDSAEVDVLKGGAGMDRLLGSSGDDVLTLSAFSATNSIELIDGDGGLNRIVGTAQANTLDFSATRLLGIAQIEGGGGNDKITGSADADVLVGNLGNDLLVGGTGGDTYRFAEGDGRDTIEDKGAEGDIDRLVIEAPWTPEEVWLLKSGNDLRVYRAPRNATENVYDWITIKGWYSTPLNRIERIELPGGWVLVAEDVEALRTVMVSMPSIAANRTATQKEQLAEAMAKAWKQ